MAGLTVTQIDEAIERIVTTGQTVSLPDGQSYTQARLADLRALRAEILTQQAAANGGGGFGFIRVAVRSGNS